MREPQIAVEANVEYAELTGIVTVGAESAEKLSKILGRKVEVGEQFDLGTLAVHYKDPKKDKKAKNKIKKHLFN